MGHLLRLVRSVATAGGAIWGLAYAPADYQQGNSFRIMYVHVPAAMLAQSLYIGMGVAGFIELVWRMKLTDVAISACLPLGMVVTALALFLWQRLGTSNLGQLVGWDGRTVSTLVLFFLYVGVFALREAIAEAELRARASALIAMVGTVNIPIIKYSVEWWNTLHQPASFSLTQNPRCQVRCGCLCWLWCLGFIVSPDSLSCCVCAVKFFSGNRMHAGQGTGLCGVGFRNVFRFFY